MTPEQYKAKFAEPTQKTQTPESNAEDQAPQKPSSEKSAKEADSRAGRALSLALDIRKFEIELYWKRATYFWAFIAAAFAGYALTYKTATEHEPWLSLLFSALGLIFSVAWYLVNRGSKFWQNNWERHVDMLEDLTVGPLYKIVATSDEGNWLTAAGQYSVSKINQLLSLFMTLIWVVLFAKSFGPVSNERELDFPKTAILIVTVVGIFALLKWGKSNIRHSKVKLTERTFEVEA
jgi:hypothetical protein